MQANLETKPETEEDLLVKESKGEIEGKDAATVIGL